MLQHTVKIGRAQSGMSGANSVPIQRMHLAVVMGSPLYYAIPVLMQYGSLILHCA